MYGRKRLFLSGHLLLIRLSLRAWLTKPTLLINCEWFSSVFTCSNFCMLFADFQAVEGFSWRAAQGKAQGHSQKNQESGRSKERERRRQKEGRKICLSHVVRTVVNHSTLEASCSDSLELYYAHWWNGWKLRESVRIIAKIYTYHNIFNQRCKIE